MTPDQLEYVPCAVCGVLAPKGKPHPPDWCTRDPRPTPPVPVFSITRRSK